MRFYIDTSRISPLKLSITAYCAAMFLDWVSTILVSIQHFPGMVEANPFARNPDMSFNFLHMLIVDSFGAVTVAALSYILYRLGQVWDQRLAEAFASAPLLYLAFDRVYDAVLQNFYFALHLYEPSKSTLDLIFN